VEVTHIGDCDATGHMNPVSKIVWNFSAQARRKRAALFRSYFAIDGKTLILDLGSEDGTNIYNVLQDTGVKSENVYIADIDAEAVKKGGKRYGFTPVVIDESGRLPFPDKFFDIVYCSSVIEHTTIAKSDLWQCRSGRQFRHDSWIRQTEFAREISRLGNCYFVQTPSKSFPIESPTWLPLVGYLPRSVFLPLLRVSNRFWVKAAEPDFNLLTKADMSRLFPDANVVTETKFGLTKSIMAIKRASN
jgi:SAM-dependent methyltransferase